MAAAPSSLETPSRRRAASPPPDMEELVEDIEYEARVDRDVSGVVDVATRSRTTAKASWAGLANAGQADDDIEALADEDGVCGSRGRRVEV